MSALSLRIEQVAGILEGYASRGVFRGFSRGAARQGKAVFKMTWHKDRSFELIVDAKRNTLRIPVVLPEVPSNSAMYRELEQFLESRESPTLPEHRRIHTAKARIRAANRGGNVSVTLTVQDGDFEYGARKLINTIHEIFMDFLSDGRYYEYQLEKFNLDPDQV
ncbi:MAG: hypothetical protein HY235_00115 [Acidobacteria bacterium]|nr:hypothetical protein [Acidobacteriota bacterium]